MKDTTASLHAVVTDAPVLGGVKMYEVKISCKGKATSMYKSKEDFRSVINMFKLVGAMARSKSAHCEVCASCSATPMLKACDEACLNAFLDTVLDKLRKSTPDAIEACSRHNGVITILMDFLSVRQGKYFCDVPEEASDEQDDVVSDLLLDSTSTSPTGRRATMVQENDLEHPIAHCSLNRTLSQRFSAMDSICNC
ncbi:hypothetical protein PybrP1_012471 [[Pythium] brassicae (nom. inval.)]|nr:hypothetical protein PybrP1_012471 [[Pythium] brassicae (nom. inval.)]